MADRLPRFHPNPTRLSLVGMLALEETRSKYLPNYRSFILDGYRADGAISQYDPFILRRGRDLHVQAARTFASEQVIQQLQEKYRRRGRDVEIVAGKGAILVKSGKKQQDVVSECDMSIHEGGVTFYVRDRTSTMGLGAASVMAPLNRPERLNAVVGSIRRSGVHVTV